MWHLDLIIPLLLSGCIAGLMAGLLGLGGGVLVVSALVFVLHKQFGEFAYLQHMAIGTSFAVMIFTSMSNAIAQHRLHNVHWDMVKKMAPGIILGTVIGSLFASSIPEKLLRIIFITFLYFLIIRMYLKRRQNLTENPRNVPKKTLLLSAGGIGIFSSWLGIGGGTLLIPFLHYCGLSLRNSMGTSAAMAWPVSVSGMIAYLIAGYGKLGLPAQSIGFIYIPGLIVLACCTMIFAPMGAKIAGRLSPQKLNLIFALMMLWIALDMTYKLWINE